MSQPPIPPAKRRRLDNAASALSRPFKSPLPRSAQRNEPTNPDTPNVAVAQFDSATPQQTPTHPRKPNPPKFQSSPSLNIKSSSPRSNPEILSLRRNRLTLQSKLTSLRNELDTAEQALRIESSSRDDELRALTFKWRAISQKAAEELFEAAKDKIERMGGVRAWRESEGQRVKRMQMWEDDSFYAGGSEDGERDKVDDVFDDYEEGSGEGKEGDEKEVSVLLLMHLLNGIVLIGCTDFYNGHDAEESEHRAIYYWLRYGGESMEEQLISRNRCFSYWKKRMRYDSILHEKEEHQTQTQETRHDESLYT